MTYRRLFALLLTFGLISPAIAQTNPNPIARTLVQGGEAAGATRTSWPIAVGGTDSSDISRVLRVDTSGRLVIASAATSAATSSIDAVNEEAALTGLPGAGVVSVIVTGTWVGTLRFAGSTDGTTYTDITSVTNGYAVQGSTTTANGQFFLLSAGYPNVRARMTAYTSGTAVVTVFQSPTALVVPTAALSIGSALVDDQSNSVRREMDILGNALGDPAFGHIFDGVAWDRVRSGAAADVSTGDGVVAIAVMARSGTPTYNAVSTVSAISDGNDGSRSLSTGGVCQFNGTAFDRVRNNVEVNLANVVAGTGTVVTSDVTNYNAKGVIIYTSVTTNPGAAQTLTINLQVKDEGGNDEYYTVATSGAIAVFGAAAGATGLEVVACCPGAAETAALVGWTTQALPLPRTWRVQVVHSGAGAWSYKVSHAYVN